MASTVYETENCSGEAARLSCLSPRLLAASALSRRFLSTLKWLKPAKLRRLILDTISNRDRGFERSHCNCHLRNDEFRKTES